MSAIDNALQALAQLSAPVKAAGRVSLLVTYTNEVNQALDQVAEYAVSIVQESLDIDFNGESSVGKEPPRKRTGSLQESIHWRDGKGSRDFPAPGAITKEAFARFKTEKSGRSYAWYQQIKKLAYNDPSMIRPYPKKQVSRKFARVIEVNPRARDRSDRQRLEYYSYYLESGWWSRGNDMHNDKGRGPNVQPSKDRPLKSPPAKYTGGPTWNEPRPYLSRLASPTYQYKLQRKYQEVLTKLNVPSELVAGATLKVEWILGRRVPFFRDNR